MYTRGPGTAQTRIRWSTPVRGGHLSGKPDICPAGSANLLAPVAHVFVRAFFRSHPLFSRLDPISGCGFFRILANRYPDADLRNIRVTDHSIDKSLAEFFQRDWFRVTQIYSFVRGLRIHAVAFVSGSCRTGLQQRTKIDDSRAASTKVLRAASGRTMPQSTKPHVRTAL